MKLKNRVVIYSWTKRKVNYFNPRETTTEICVKITEKGEPDMYWTIPRFMETPAQIECYCKGLEDMNRNIKIERTDYEY